MNFSEYQFNKIKSIRDECRNHKTPKEIYGLLSILLHKLAGQIVAVDDDAIILDELLFTFLQIAAECQYGCEQLKLIEPQLDAEQKENLWEKQAIEYRNLLKQTLLAIKSAPIHNYNIQKGMPNKRLYEINDELLQSIQMKIK